jgi:branched-chain amino acid aminotransferase
MSYQNRLTFEQVVEKLREPAHIKRTPYLAMYSSWLEGIVMDPQLMWVPVDDHIVHRGDGVFEAIKCVDGKIYALDRHLERLEISAQKIGLKLPIGIEEIREVCLATTKAARDVSKSREFILRLYLSRGPGGFTTNPYECIASQIYLVVTEFKPYAAAKYETGVSAAVSEFSVKESFFANVKSCNYLPNVLMKKEAIDQGVDFTVSRDEQGFLAEGSTENFAIISRDGDLVVPPFDRILRGVTAVRVMELAQVLVADGSIRKIINAPLSINDVYEAQEAMFFGTTLDVLPVTKFNDHKIGNGDVGPACRQLLNLIRVDLRTGEGMVTDIS